MAGNDGGVLIDLDEMNRLEAEKKARQDAEAKAAEEKAKRNAFVGRRSELLWAYNFYVLGSGPAFLSLVTLLTGPFIKHYTADESCQQLRHFVGLSIFTAWTYLFIYNWLIMGPLPFKGKMKPLKIIFGVFTIWSVVVYSIGGVFLVMWPSCVDESPMEFRYCQLQIFMFLFGFVTALLKFAKERWNVKQLERRKAKRARMKEQIKNEQKAAAVEVDEDEDEDEDEEAEDDGEDEEAEDDDDDEEEENGKQ